jgi:hypothetical protein
VLAEADHAAMSHPAKPRKMIADEKVDQVDR